MPFLAKALYALTLVLCLNFGAFAQGEVELPGFGGGGGDDPVRHYDTAELEIRTLEKKSIDGVFGESYSHRNGTVSFYNVDVSLPGNSHLPVRFARRLETNADVINQNLMQNWSIDVPYIFGVEWVLRDGMCNTGWALPISRFGDPDDYEHAQEDWRGLYLMNGPSGSRAIGYVNDTNFPTGDELGTMDHWRIKCLSNPGRLEAIAPNGDKYYFDDWENDRAYASRVEDVHGNWVQYEQPDWVAGTPGRIWSNDGREIIYYMTPGGHYDRQVDRVVANGRTWTYTYHSNDTLKRVTLPDGRYWEYGSDSTSVHTKFRWYQGPYIPEARTGCVALEDFTVKDPDGVQGTFEFEKIRVGNIKTYPKAAGINPSSEPAYSYDATTTNCSLNQRQANARFAKGLVKKTITVPRGSTSVWTYEYEEANWDIRNENQANEKRWINDPLGDRTEYYTEGEGYLEGTITSVKKYRGGALIQTTTSTYYRAPHYMTPFNSDIKNQSESNEEPSKYPSRLSSQSITQDGDTYTTSYQYQDTMTATDYAFGEPKKVTKTSSTSSLSRIYDLQYQTIYRTDRWITALVKQVTRNSKVFDKYTYNNLGQITQHDRFGVKAATFGYHTSDGSYFQKGRLAWVKDALDRETKGQNYKRGQAQKITLADQNIIWRTVDDNGWMTSETNPRGYTTGFVYDSVGRITKVDLHGTWWDDVDLNYSSLGNGAVVTQTRGDARTVTTYDGLNQPILVQSTDLTGVGDTTYVKTEYDVFGRATFASWPSLSSNPTTGVNSTYDGLGRVTQTQENVSPFATTTTTYLSGNKVRVTDPSGAQTTTTYRSYGSPGTDEPTLIQQPEGMTTSMTYDSWGNLLSASQGGYTQTWTYDTRLRLCNHYTPEQGGTVYAYNNANEVTYTARGQGTGCTSNSADRIYNTYDDMGRLTLVNYPSGTPDVTLGYDANGNLISNVRGNASWTYVYGSLDYLNQENLVIDGRTYTSKFGFRTGGAISSRTTPAGRTITYSPDGFGRATKAGANGTEYANNVTYHPNGAMKGMDLGNGRFYETTLNARQQVHYMHYWGGFSWGLVYDANGRMIQIDDKHNNNRDRTFTYDDLGRLDSATGPWGNATYQYDAANNLTRKQLGSRVVEIEFNNKNQVLRARDSGAGNVWQNYTHDARGNVTDNGPINFTYDAAMQPTSISGSDSGSFVYDGNYKRVKQTINGETIYSVYGIGGQLLYRDNATTGEATDYIRVGSMTVAELTNGVAMYVYLDPLGTPMRGTETDIGQWEERYTPFGEKWMSDSARDDEAGFTGHISDTDTGLTYMQARYYDPVIGRFLSVDPVDFDTGGPAYFNRYVYTANDPVNAIDPNGMGCNASRIGAAAGSICGGSLNGELDGDFDLKSEISEKTAEVEYQNEQNAITEARRFAGTNNGSAEDASLEVITAIIGLKGIDKGIKTGFGLFAAKEVAEETGETAVQKLTHEIRDWLGGDYTTKRAPNGNYIFQGSNSSRRVRIDFKQDSPGKFKGPHIQFEQRNIKGDFEPADGVPPHIYFGSD